MIEKFSEEELKQILSELGIREKGIRTEYFVAKELQELKEIFKEKPRFANECMKGKAYENINCLISITLNNLIQTKQGNWRVAGSVKESDQTEFREMFREILEIIKKHNRKWE